MMQRLEQIMGAAVQFHQSGQLADAEPLYRQVLAQNPDEPDALHLLGVLLSQLGRGGEALSLLQRAAKLRPQSPDILSNLAIALAQSGEAVQAADAFRAALKLRPDHPDANFNLGNLLMEVGDLDQAIPLLRKAVALQPGNVQVQEKLGDALRRQGLLAEALAIFQQVLKVMPNRAETHNLMGVTLAGLGGTHKAIESFQKAISLRADYADPHNNLGLCLQGRGQTEQAIDEYRTAIRLRPNFPGALNNLGNLLKECDQLDQAIDAYRKALTLKPDLVQAHDNLLLSLQAHPEYDAAAIFRDHVEWNRLHADVLGGDICPYGNNRDPDRRLKIGYVSPDFREHSVAYFLEGLLANHDARQVEIFCYADVAREDAVTQRFRKAAHHWRSLIGLSDARVAEIVRQDGIDILVDLAGHTGDNRLLAFARKPAPVQVTYVGYPGTTGLRTMDWRLTDGYADPPGIADPSYSEKLYRLPRTFLCFSPSPGAPPVAPPPSLATGQITFGSFNYLPKINPAVVEVWSEILRQIPGSRLLLKSHGLSDDFSRRRMLDRFAAGGIDSGRLVLFGKIPSLAAHLQLYDKIDVALDPFPYNGTTTTCEALWMGVPVITLAGRTHAGRVGVSLLSNVGLPQLIAQNRKEYVRIAANLAADLAALANLRGGLRQRVAESPLADAKSFSRDVEAAYRQMWRQWCA